MVVKNEEKILAKNGRGDSDHDNIFCGFDSLPKDKRDENTAKRGKKYTLTTSIAPAMLKILIKCSK